MPVWKPGIPVCGLCSDTCPLHGIKQVPRAWIFSILCQPCQEGSRDRVLVKDLTSQNATTSPKQSDLKLKRSSWHLTLPCSSHLISNQAFQLSSVQLLSHVQLFATPWTATHQVSPSITNSRSLLKLLFIESVIPSNHLILCHPLLLLPTIIPSIKVFSSELGLHIRWPKYQGFSFSINPSNEYAGLICFRIDWFDLLAVQGTLKSLLQHYSSKASTLWCSAFFIVQLSHPYMTTGKTIALTRWTFVGKVMSLLFNMLSRLVDICMCI